jgi:hypothetical protein
VEGSHSYRASSPSSSPLARTDADRAARCRHTPILEALTYRCPWPSGPCIIHVRPKAVALRGFRSATVRASRRRKTVSRVYYCKTENELSGRGLSGDRLTVGRSGIELPQGRRVYLIDRERKTSWTRAGLTFHARRRQSECGRPVLPESCSGRKNRMVTEV